MWRRSIHSLTNKVGQFCVFILVTVTLFICGDLLLGHFLNDGVAYMCRDELLHHRYCPQSRRTYRMTEVDGGQVIDSYWNNDSIRVKNKKDISSHSDFQSYEHLLIGDSFIAQRQVQYEERLSSIINESLGGQVSVQFGTGSWNMVTYTQAIKYTSPRKGQKVHIFLMANDFYSNGYGMSTARYYEKFKEMNITNISWPGNRETVNSIFRRWLSNNSFTYQYFKFRSKSSNAEQQSAESEELSLINITEIEYDCEKLEEYRSQFKSSKTFALIEHAFDISCYDDQAISNLRALVKLDAYLQKLAIKEGFSLYYYFIPNGTFNRFEGHGFKIAYGLDKDSSITSEGMREAIEESLEQPVFSFEDFFKHLGDMPLKYYSHDGHWNSLGSYLVAIKLLEVFSNIQ